MTRTILFSATWRGRYVTVGMATDAELRSTTRRDLPGGIRDILQPSMLFTLQEVGVEGVRVHALGWRVGLCNTWIMSALVGIDAGRTVIRTSSGHTYGLMDLQDDRPIPELMDHLGYALRAWGFDDVVVA